MCLGLQRRWIGYVESKQPASNARDQSDEIRIGNLVHGRLQCGNFALGHGPLIPRLFGSDTGTGPFGEQELSFVFCTTCFVGG